MKVRGGILACILGIVSIAAARQPAARPRPSPLAKMSTQELVNCFADSTVCGANNWDVADVLAKRDVLRSLIARYWREKNPEIRSGIEKVAYRKNSPVATKFMKKVVTSRIDDGEDLYYPINYLAKQCDSGALRQLATGRFRFEGSLQYQTSVELFGKCEYKPAIPYLVDTALKDVSLNVVVAAVDSLHKLFPGSPKEFKTLKAVQEYFCNRAFTKGYQVSCKAARTQAPE